MTDFNTTLTVMENAAINAARVLAKMQPKSKRLESRKDFLTDADLASEKVILSALAAKFPDIPVLSEEKGGAETKEGYLWVVDPIDGTINFFLQDDHWGISIALVKNGRTIAGVVYLPARGQMFSASSEHAATCRLVGKKQSAQTHIKVATGGNLHDEQIWVEWGKEGHGGTDHAKVYDLLERLDRHTLYPQIRNSTTATLMAVACGKIAGAVIPKPEPFDIAAAGLIVERAGGTVTDMSGKPWGPFSRSLVASNGLLRNDLLRILKAD
ncbi:MAG: Inositol-phosphate phosphatase [Parcubacteria group bacterium GW2011_GWA2_49_9]|nr:MAG: Inositol-phosphate phosphatase [Parcubacteria group bacterium GW2011_GWA2_49_9]